jgi:purine-nucleoside/S-methyl-5'-thioadenosine phosphorylase / adenosine deaminase
VSLSILEGRITASLVDAEAEIVREIPLVDSVPLYGHPQWNVRFPWLLQGITGRGPNDPYDLSFFGQASTGNVLERWRAIRNSTAFRAVVHAHQVHGAVLLEHETPPEDGVLILDDADGHLTRQTNLLLAVSVADCVPISLLDERSRTIALLHAGWRGVAAGILERGVEKLRQRGGAAPREVLCHLGPAICGSCYEVGPEVHEALGRQPPAQNTPIDLRSELVRRALALDLQAANISRSAFCTRCDGKLFFSHRGGDPQRQMSVLGLRRA